MAGILIPLTIHSETSKVLLNNRALASTSNTSIEGINESLEPFLKAPSPVKINWTTVSSAVNKDLIEKKPSVGPEVLEGFYDMLKKYDWDVKIAYRILLCESQGNSKAWNYSDITGDDSIGLMQINLYGKLAKVRPKREWLFIPENNISYAYQVYKSSGWKAWSCY